MQSPECKHGADLYDHTAALEEMPKVSRRNGMRNEIKGMLAMCVYHWRTS
jgi:hypothetical protein